MGILALLFAFIACDNDNGDTHTHDYGTAWKSNATQHWKECSCGDKTDVANHQWGNWSPKTPATYDTDGEEERPCTVCGATETQPIAKFKTEQSFTIGSVNFIFEYRRDDTTSWGKLSAGVQTYISRFEDVDPDPTYTTPIVNLSTRNGAMFRIIVDYSNEGKDAGFTATDGQTLIVGSVYLASTTISGSIFRSAFNAILEKPWPII